VARQQKIKGTDQRGWAKGGWAWQGFGWHRLARSGMEGNLAGGVLTKGERGLYFINAKFYWANNGRQIRKEDL